MNLKGLFPHLLKKDQKIQSHIHSLHICTVYAYHLVEENYKHGAVKLASSRMEKKIQVHL